MFNFLDILAHRALGERSLQELAPDEAAFRAVMKAWFTHSPLYDILRALSSQDCSVVLTTDHGAVLGRRAALVYGNRDTSTNLRYKYGVNLNCDAKQAVIVRKPRDYMLPDEASTRLHPGARGNYFVFRRGSRVRAPVPRLVHQAGFGRGDYPAAHHPTPRGR